jgi:chorismate mutase
MENSALDIDKNWSESNKPFRFFGPCSAESPEQLEQTAAGIHQHYPEAIFRAGVWKPRTRPNSFEGIGEEALEWLKAIKAKHHFPIAIEVANVQHLEKALEAGVDMLWIGARTTVNPFSVQEIADGLKGVDVPVFVKNPINPDLSLWIGALERINKAGITKLGAIHRGFHLSDNGPYRNYPYWSLAVQLKAEFPNLPIVCDASHISGKPDLIPQVSQKAYDLDMDGIMIETHYDPNLALSDKEQQLTPEQLHGVLSKLIRKRKFSSNEEFKNQLEILRNKIDKVDDELMDLIAVRMDIAKQIGIYKKNNKVTILQIERWKQILSRVLKNGKALDLSEDFINAIFNSIHDESIRQQTLVQNGDSKDA